MGKQGKSEPTASYTTASSFTSIQSSAFTTHSHTYDSVLSRYTRRIHIVVTRTRLGLAMASRDEVEVRAPPTSRRNLVQSEA